MKIVDRYLTKELMLPLTYCLAGFTMLYVVFDVFDKLSTFISAKAPAMIILKYYGCHIALMVEFIFPACMLLSTLYTLWNLTRNNELIAMRASGISMLRIMTPFLSVAIMLSLTVLLTREFVVTKTAFWAKNLEKTKFKQTEKIIIKDVAYYNDVTKRQWLIGQIDINHPEEIEHLRLTSYKRDGTRISEIYARKASWLDGKWWLFRMQAQEFNEDGYPSKNYSVTGSEYGKLMINLTERPMDFLTEIKPLEQHSLVETRRYMRTRKDLTAEVKTQLSYDFHQRTALPWACLIVTIFAIPAGASSGRQSMISGVFTAIALFFGYYLLIQLGMYFGKKNIIAPWLGAWIPNIVFFLAGILMFRRIR